MSDERRYTLSEAKREFAKEECGRRGHDFNVVVRGDGTPTSVVCERCGRSWSVAPEAAQ